MLAPGKRTLHTLLPGMLFRDGERRPWVVAGLDGRRRPAADPRPGRVGARRRRGRRRDGRRRAALVRRAGDEHFAPPVDVRARARAPGRASSTSSRRWATRVDADDRRSTAALGHAHAIELVDGGPAAPDGSVAAATDPEAQLPGWYRRASASTRGRPGTAAPSRSGDSDVRERRCCTSYVVRAQPGCRPAGCAHTTPPPVSVSRSVESRDLERRPELPVHERDRGRSRRRDRRARRGARRAWPTRSRPRRRRSTRNDRWWVWKCPTPGCPGLLHAAGYAPRSTRCSSSATGPAGRRSCAERAAPGRRTPRRSTAARRCGPPRAAWCSTALGIIVSAAGFGLRLRPDGPDGRASPRSRRWR